MSQQTSPVDSSDSPRQGVKKERKLLGDRSGYFLNRFEGETGTNVSACYQCERCTNACPVAHYMDIKPHQVIRFIQLGWREELLRSSTIWVCLSCEMCSTYCPNEVGVAESINYLRNMAAHSSIPPKERHLAVFHQTFLEELERHGRVNEFWLMGAFNLKPKILKEKIKSGLFKDELLQGLTLWKKGRLVLLPGRSRAIKDLKKVFRQKQGEIS